MCLPTADDISQKKGQVQRSRPEGGALPMPMLHWIIACPWTESYIEGFQKGNQMDRGKLCLHLEITALAHCFAISVHCIVGSASPSSLLLL